MRGLSLKQLTKRHWRRAGSLALAALAVFAGLPKAGCICADGSFRQFCPVLAKHQAAEAKPASCCQPKACEHSPEAAQSCCQAQQPAGDHHTVRTHSESCCQPTVYSPSATPLYTAEELFTQPLGSCLQNSFT